MSRYTFDVVLGGSLRLFQREKGYRFSIDALLLGNFVEVSSGPAFEIGSGCGIVSLMVAMRFPKAKVVGMEVQEELFNLSVVNRYINSVWNAFFIHGDARRIKEFFKDSSFEVVFSNPPYREIKSGKLSPVKEKLIARHEVSLTLEELVRVSSYLLKPRGRLYMIYRSERLPELVYLLERRKMHPCAIVPIFSDSRGVAELFLVEAEKGSRRELEVIGPISLYDGRGERTSFHMEVSSRLFRGGKELWKGIPKGLAPR